PTRRSATGSWSATPRRCTTSADRQICHRALRRRAYQLIAVAPLWRQRQTLEVAMAKLNSADAARRVPVRSIGIIDPDALTVDEIQQLDDADQRLLVHNKVLDLVHFREGLSKLGRHVDLAVDLI